MRTEKVEEGKGLFKHKRLVVTAVVFLLIGIGLGPMGSDTQFIPIVSGGGVTDHGALNGLGDDDHSQYILHTELDSEAELESQIVGVTNVFTNNDLSWFIESYLNCDNAPVDEYVLTYESSTGNFEWQQDQTGAGGGPSMAFHNHNQDLNDTATPSFPDMYLEQTLYHKGDLDTNILFTTDNIKLVTGGVQIFEVSKTFGKIKAVDNTFFEVESTGTDSDSWVNITNDGKTWQILNTGEFSDKFWIVDKGTGIRPFTIEQGATQNSQIHLDNNGGVDIAGGSPNYRLELPNTATNLGGRGNAEDWHTYSDLRFKEDFSGLPESYVITLCRIIDWRIYKPISNWQDENGTIYKGDVEDNFCIGAYAQVLYWDIINSFGNTSIARKIANNIVNVPNDPEKEYWSVSYSTILRIYARGLQIVDDYLTKTIQHTKHMESWAEQFGYVPLDWD